MARTLTPSDGLTIKESARLAELEAVVEAHKDGWFRAGSALTEIRDSKLYRATHGTFANYIRDRWGLGKSYAYALIQASTEMSAIADKIPNEAVARELVNVEPEARQAVLDAVSANGKPTASGVRGLLDSVLPKNGTAKKGPITAESLKAATAKARGEKVDAAPAMLDELKREVPLKLQPIFAGREEITEAMSLIAKARKALKAIAEKPYGAGLASQAIDIDLKNAWQAVKFGRPYTICVSCNAKKSKCEACKGRGWMVEMQYKSAPSELKESREDDE